MHPRLNEIATLQWAAVLDHFSRAHAGQLAELVVISPDSGRHPQAHQLPLLGVSAEPSNGGQSITITAGDRDGVLLSHEIQHPSHVRLAEWNDGVSGELEVDAEDGFQVRLQVGPPEQMLPPGAILDGNYPRL
jgi:hypothetical protein